MSGSDIEMVAKYKIFSKTYDNLFLLLERIVFWNEGVDPRAALTRKIPPGDSLRILDVCCGTGRDSLAIAKANHIVTGIDLSPDMLALANKKRLKLGIRNVSFHQMDATRLDFQDEEFDVIVSSFALHEMDYDSMKTVLEEMHRVLREEGRLYLVDYGREDGFIRQWVFSAYLKICYPQRVQEFLDHDWRQILHRLGLQLDSIEKYRVSRLISATRPPRT